MFEPPTFKPGAENSSDTESVPSPSRSDPSKAAQIVPPASDPELSTPKAPSTEAKAPELFSELQVKVEKSPEGAASGESAFQDEAKLQPKSEPQDAPEAEGRVKTEPDTRDKETLSEQMHSDNDSSATCSADEDVDAEPDRQR